VFLETHRITALLCWTLSAPGAWADSNVAYPIQYRFQGAFGFDAWDISKNSESSVMDRLLFLADSTPQWSERNPSPWVRFDSEALFSQQLSGRFKFRGSQSSDWRIDELNLNWQASPTLGATIGVVDYKTSWCRAYDVDSPWVRENDPFCTVRTTEQATGAAPGAQLHTNWSAGAWMWQALIGTYNPLLLDYDEKEFNNTPLRDASFVASNRKHGISVNAVHLPTGAEFRLSYLETEQLGRYKPSQNALFYDKPQDVDLIYAGLSLPLHPRLQVRVTQLDSRLNSRFYPSDSPAWIFDYTYLRESTTAELYWKLNEQDTLGIGFSKYSADEKTVITRKIDVNEKLQRRASSFTNELWSVSWRRDWSRKVYTAIQWSESQSENIVVLTGSPATTQLANGDGIGIRLGVRF
jgi:hypothetical protein